jgi:Glycosyl transferase family 2
VTAVDSGILLVVFTDGRADYLHRTLTSFREKVTGPFARMFIFDDSNDETYTNWVAEHFPDFAVLPNVRRLGFAGTIARAWDLLAYSPERYLFHLEDDFTFNRHVALGAMIDCLDSSPDLAQMALIRQAWNDDERQHGGVIEAAKARGVQFTPVSYQAHRWLEHRGWFPTALCRRGWPLEPESEGKFGLRLLEDPALRFGFWGDGEPWVTHIGGERAGTGY